MVRQQRISGTPGRVSGAQETHQTRTTCKYYTHPLGPVENVPPPPGFGGAPVGVFVSLVVNTLMPGKCKRPINGSALTAAVVAISLGVPRGQKLFHSCTPGFVCCVSCGIWRLCTQAISARRGLLSLVLWRARVRCLRPLTRRALSTPRDVSMSVAHADSRVASCDGVE